jgi:hypothetical protein
VTDFVLSPANARHRALGLICAAKLGMKQPWFVSKLLARAKDSQGAMSVVVAKDRGRSFRYFRKADRPDRAGREAHKDFVRLNMSAA